MENSLNESEQKKCNHLGFGHELCKECSSVIKCDGCGDNIKYDFWNTAFEEKLGFLMKREQEFVEREKKVKEKENKIKELMINLD